MSRKIMQMENYLHGEALIEHRIRVRCDFFPLCIPSFQDVKTENDVCSIEFKRITVTTF